MRLNRTLLVAAMAAALLAGCKKNEEAAEVAAPEQAAPAAEPAAQAEPAPAATPEAAAPVAKAFDIEAVAVSDKPLGEWPYLVLPAGYELDNADDIARRSKDLARVPVWTGGELLWVEGRTFVDEIDNADGKTFSKFELRKGLQQAIEALGGVRIGERSFPQAVYKANEKAINDFTAEFNDMHNAYWYDNDADTWVIRRADKAIWLVTDVNNDRGKVMVAEGPLPPPPAQ